MSGMAAIAKAAQAAQSKMPGAVPKNKPMHPALIVLLTLVGFFVFSSLSQFMSILSASSSATGGSPPSSGGAGGGGTGGGTGDVVTITPSGSKKEGFTPVNLDCLSVAGASNDLYPRMKLAGNKKGHAAQMVEVETERCNKFPEADRKHPVYAYHHDASLDQLFMSRGGGQAEPVGGSEGPEGTEPAKGVKTGALSLYDLETSNCALGEGDECLYREIVDDKGNITAIKNSKGNDLLVDIVDRVYGRNGAKAFDMNDPIVKEIEDFKLNEETSELSDDRGETLKPGDIPLGLFAAALAIKYKQLGREAPVLKFDGMKSKSWKDFVKERVERDKKRGEVAGFQAEWVETCKDLNKEYAELPTLTYPDAPELVQEQRANINKYITDYEQFYSIPDDKKCKITST